MMPYGCEAILSIVPVDGTGTIEPDSFDRPGVHFAIDAADVSGRWKVGQPIDAPTALGPGASLVIGGITVRSDVSSIEPDP